MGEHSYEYLSSVLQYDPKTGDFTWKVSRGPRVAEGYVAGTISRGGYVVIGVERKYYRAHRLAWFLTHGEWPKDVIDHINGDTADNRLANLRAATQAENSRNQKVSRNNASGFKGVHWHSRKGMWVASIRVNRKLHHLGYFETPESAAKAYDKASIRLHGEYGRLSFKAMLTPKNEQVSA